MFRLSTASLAVVLSAFISGCQQANQAESAAPAAPPPVAVTTVEIQREPIPIEFEYVGQVAGSLEVEIRNRITGIIEQRHFTEGSEVNAGQLLFSLDDALFKAEYQQALAAIETAEAQKLTAQAQLKQAQRELKRVTPLARQNMVSQNQLDDAASAVDIAQAQLAVAEASIQQAEANKLSARINLDYTRIKAPVAGIVGRVQQNRGALVQDLNNSLLTTLVQIDPVYVNFGIPENEWLGIRDQLNDGGLKLDGERLNITLIRADGKRDTRSGTLDFRDYKVDGTTGNFAMRATLDNAARDLSPGQFVRVVLNGIFKPDAIAIPQRAVLDGPTGKYVYVMTAGEQGSVAMQKPIELGQWVDLDQGRDNYWIVNSGIEPGDKVIVDGVARIFFPGMSVAEPTATAETTTSQAQ